MKYNDCKSELFEFAFLSGLQPSGAFLRKRNIWGQNPYVCGTIWSSFTIDFFVYWESGSRRCSKMAINWVVSSIVIPNKYYGVKVPLVRSPLDGFLGAGAPPKMSTPFLPGRRHSSGSEAPPKGSTLVKLIVDTQRWLRSTTEGVDSS